MRNLFFKQQNIKYKDILSLCQKNISDLEKKATNKKCPIEHRRSYPTHCHIYPRACKIFYWIYSKYTWAFNNSLADRFNRWNVRM